MNVSIIYKLNRLNDDNDIVYDKTLYVSGVYESGERPERWGYYGASPGEPDYVEIESINVKVHVEGPVPNPHTMALYAHRNGIEKLSNEMISYHELFERGWSKNPRANQTVSYLIPWDGELDAHEEEAVKEALIEQALDDIRASREAAAEIAYDIY